MAQEAGAFQSSNIGAYVQRMPNLEEEILVCTSCQYGKQNRLPFPLNKA
jgi:hypothetical protein